MLIDSLLLFDQGAAHLTTGASTNHIDLGIARNLGVGEVLYLFVSVTAAFTDAGSDSTMTVTLESDNDPAFGSVDFVQTIGTFPALSAIGTRLVAKLQPDLVNSRYARVKYTVANGDLTTGSFTAAIVKDIDAYTAYANNYTIS